ncbi:PD-(D/E)XK nuclease family protein [Aphanothece sacrum]|uniref:Superfamily I DNA and RNA helicases n=1 Tax=Aphanothece sacrum FPU1 TaxID=1920663 RepID=A0A401IJT1_APHSA|nr:PD-(D/E)XK nuclease family protein [Aphanothece sacrum]GBF81537.1 superfamily I DNA and RNA helicases [Aphanothece sacrum FPU1]GBF87006.1 helicase [Aphanothece sacrum FPU3]
MDKPLIRLSQSQLNLLETCPPQFQRLYLEDLGTPPSPDTQDSLSWGSQFHQLMQQEQLGLPIQSFLGEDQELQKALNALVNVVKIEHHLTEESWKEAEHSRSLEFDNYLLTAIYDLLILEDNRAQILDWKTYLKPQNKEKLAKNWQTRLYLYLLAETSDYLPEQISMTYWFVKLPNEPQSLTFTYDSKTHQKTAQDLSYLLGQLESWLSDYLDNKQSFNHISNCQSICPYYETFFDNNLDLDDENKENDWLFDLDEIEEIAVNL